MCYRVGDSGYRYSMKARLVLTAKGHRALGHKKCPDCKQWFEPRVKRQVFCPRCERLNVEGDRAHMKSHRYPRADLMLRGEESYEE